MLLGLLADVHSNLEALQACVAHARRAGAERYAFLGDLVGYGADPQAVVDAVRESVGAGSIAVAGNHDAAVAGDGSFLNRPAREAIEWTRRQLDAESIAFLAALPLTAHVGEALLVHASAHRPAQWTYVDTRGEAQKSVAAAGATWTLSGHVHDQTLYFQSAPGRMAEFLPQAGTAIPVRAPRRWLAIAGSVGQPRDGSPSAAYALLDLTRQAITFHRVAYDSQAAAAKVRRAGLPAAIAYRVERGI